MSQNLYDAPVQGEYSFLCGGNGGDNPNESCLGLAPVEGGAYSIVGNKPEDKGRELRGTLPELQGLYRQLSQIPGITG
jgi:hypothetical protein